MLGRRHVYHVSPFASTPHRSSPGYAHSPPSPWSYEGFRKPENEKSYTIELITALFCQVDDQLAGLPKHPEAHLWPSEVVTLGLLHALKGGGNRPFYRWLTVRRESAL